MVRMTVISRIPDGLLLCASMESENDTAEMTQYKNKAKDILKTIVDGTPKCINDPPFYFLYIVVKNVVYLCLCDKAYPKKLSYSYLEELSKEFDQCYGSEVPAAQRPYQFIKFDTFIQKTKKLYNDTRSQRNLSKVSEELAEVHSIFTQSISELVSRGERLNSVAKKSGDLMSETSKYRKQAHDFRLQMLWRKWAPVVVLVVIALIFIIFRYYIWA